ncbi:MAG: uroporphyrinogen-III synthase, partial [Armatimonadota bacterium]
AELDAALDRMAGYDWLLFTSANGVRATAARLRRLGRDIRALAGPKVGAIGPATAESLESLGLKVDFVPSKFVAEAFVEEFPEDPRGKRFLIVRAEEAREVLPDRLTERGAQVDVLAAYRTEIEDTNTRHVREMLETGEIDVITFTSSSTVTNFARLIGGPDPAHGAKVACIGPITARTAEEAGLKPDIVAEEYTIEGLVEAIVAAFAPRS